MRSAGRLAFAFLAGSILFSLASQTGLIGGIQGVLAETQTYSYLYGCTAYTQNIDHCDPILNSFQSNSVDTSLVQTMLVPSHPSYINSKYQSALDIKANSLDLVRIDNNRTYNNTNFTVYAAVKPTNTENILGSLISFRSDMKNAGWELVSLPSNATDTSVLRFTLFNTNGDAQSTPDVKVPSGKFLDVVGTFDGSTIKLYVDGELKSSSKFQGSFKASPSLANPLTIGAGSYCSCSTVTASYDELRLYNRTLSDQEVTNINASQESSAGQNNPVPAGLVGQWKFNGDLTDSSPYHNDAKYWSLVASMATTPDGRVLLTEKNSGKIDVLQNDGKLLEKPFATISPIQVGWEQGLLGITLDDNYTANHYVYAYYNYPDKDSGNIYARVIRLTDNNNTGTDMKIIYDKIPASNGFHTGGAIRFNPVDDKLYVFVGDATQRDKAQDLTVLNGKLLRLNRDGSIPSDNPFQGSPIFTYGHRNAFGLAFDPSGNGILAESREDLYDQVDFIQKGGNYGWPTMQKPNESPYGNNSSIKPIRSYYVTPSPTETIYYTGDKFPELKNSFVFGTVRGDLYSLKISNSTHTLTSELKLLLHRYPYEPIVAVTQLPSGDILIGGYNIYKLKSIDSTKQTPLMFPVQVNTTNASISGVNYNLEQKRVTVDIGNATGNNTVTVAMPTTMLSSGIKDAEQQATTVLANDGENATVELPYSQQTRQNGGIQTVSLQFPDKYSTSDHMQILISGSGASITKTAPEFSQIAAVSSLAVGLAIITLYRRLGDKKPRTSDS